ncbi:SCP-2 sterol transfer family [Aspergillus sclerotialis]|uniref:SCP-2 sterol transfer family n=1 Tax=Aspergillus sclerotialis TaxID=2070753 RepID=A0A3A2ZDE8_9EURO|nr:SCP-2 sterol transfer family [Aspergillus sclerotialis]
MSLKNDAFPSSAAFDLINSTLQSDAAERKDAVEKAKAVVAFTLKNADGKEESWYLDLKEKGEVGKGAAPSGGKADVTLQLSDSDFASLVSGKANAQRLFMGGKLKIKGNIMKATKMEPVLKKAQGKAKL